ncbi:MAG: hypothetical protein ACR2HQ_11795 [Ilumatobacteraceae bacterium]
MIGHTLRTVYNWRHAIGTGRRLGASALGVVGVSLLVLSLIAVWERQTVSDGARIRQLTAEAIGDPEVTAALADQLAALLAEAVAVEAALDSLLPDQLDRLGSAIADRAQEAVARGAAAVIADPRTQTVLADLAEVAHGFAMSVLRGDGLADGVTVTGETVTINLLPLVGAGVEQLQGLGLLRSVQLPPLPIDGDPAEQIAAVEAALDRDLADDFGQLVV